MTHPNTPAPDNEIPAGTPPEVALLMVVMRLETKVDVALAQHGADIKAQGKDIEDHESRLRVLELRPTVSPRVLWTTVASAAGLVLASMPLVEKILGP